MAELLDVVNAFTPPLKVAWVVWLAWGVAQVVWYRHERKPQVASARKPSAAHARKTLVSRPSAPERMVTRLVTPEPVLTHQAEPHTPARVAPEPAADNVAEVAELDRFVADFEMNTRHRRGEPHNGEPYNAQLGG
jgi:hypothetical protein